MKTKYIIRYTGMQNQQGHILQNTDGYFADDYLPGWREQIFNEKSLGYRWIKENHKGPDCDGVEARFIMEEL